MKKLFVPFVLLSLMVGCSEPDPWSKAVSKKINQNSYAEPWPFKGFMSGTLTCVPNINPALQEGSAGKKYSYIIFTPDAEPGKKYALNGTAMSYADKEGFYNANTIRTRDLYLGLGNTNPLIQDGLKLCDQSN